MIPLHKVFMADDVLEKIKPTLYSGMITEGPRVKELELRLSEYFGAPVLATNSCTSAIDLALHLCGVGFGDQVVTTPLTCFGSNCNVIHRRAKLVWCDLDALTGCALPFSIANLVTDRTRAIIVVDWGGRPVDCSAIRSLLPRPIPIIQDAAHSFGAMFNGLKAHTNSCSGEYVAWSFQAIKHLTTGDGGALKAPADQFERARALRWFGIDREKPARFRFLQDIPEAGHKYHMGDIPASIGVANFEGAVRNVGLHRRRAHSLDEQLSGTLKHVLKPPFDDGSSWWFYSILTPKWEQFVDFSAERGIVSGPVHGRNDMMSCCEKSDCLLPGLDSYASRHVALPCGWWLTESDVEKIAQVVIEWDKSL